MTTNTETTIRMMAAEVKTLRDKSVPAAELASSTKSIRAAPLTMAKIPMPRTTHPIIYIEEEKDKYKLTNDFGMNIT